MGAPRTMTNQSQPDLQNGDGLRADIDLIGHALSRGGHPSGTTHAFHRIRQALIPPDYRDDDIFRIEDGAEIIFIASGGEQHRIVYDLAEDQKDLGSGWFLHPDDPWEAAPPQPAPDAMREALKATKTELSWCIGQLMQQGHTFTTASKGSKAIQDAEAALSAPVPPADGAGEQRGHCWCGLHLTLRHQCDRCMKRGKFSPSGAVAAEPVDDQDPPMKWLIDSLRNLARDLLADPKTPWIGERDPKLHICWTAADRLHHLNTRALHAETVLAEQDLSPPVRGDRETIARTLYECEKRRGELTQTIFEKASGKPCPGAGMEPWDECKDVFLSDADALIAAGLVVPVQPGAGERE
jgi:hypothetical protein